MELILKKGGKLYAHKFAEKRMRDRTKAAPSHLFDHCELDKDVTLRDVFLLLNRHLKFFDLVFGNWCKEIVTDGLSKRFKRNPRTDDIDFVELYCDISEHDYGKKYPPSTSGFRQLSFDGVGILKKDLKDRSAKKGDTIRFAIELTEPWKLMSYPLKLRKTIEIRRELPKKNEVFATFRNPEFTLGDILYGVIWELSFYGPPAKAKEFREELDRRVNEIKSGKAKLVKWDPKKLRSKLKAKKG
jgi:hypothetical protein